MRPLDFEIRGEDRSSVAFDRLRKNVRQTEGAFSSLAGRVGSAFRAVGTLRNALIGLGAGGGLVLLTKNALNTAEALNDAAAVANTTAEQLQVLRFAADQNASSAGQMDEAVRRLTRRMSLFAQTGGGPAKDAIAALGIEVRGTDGALRNSGDVFLEIADKMANMRDQTQAAALASQFFGEDAGPKLVPLLSQGAGAIEGYNEDLREMGALMSNEVAQAAADASARLRALSNIIGAQLTTALAQVGPQVASMVQSFSDNLPVVLNFIQRVGQAIGLLGAPIEAQIDGKIAEVSAVGADLEASIARLREMGVSVRQRGIDDGIDLDNPLRLTLGENGAANYTNALGARIDGNMEMRKAVRAAIDLNNALIDTTAEADKLIDKQNEFNRRLERAAEIPPPPALGGGGGGGGGGGARKRVEETRAAVEKLETETLKLGSAMTVVNERAEISFRSIQSLGSGLLRAATGAGTFAEKMIRVIEVIGSSELLPVVIDRLLNGGGGAGAGGSPSSGSGAAGGVLSGIGSAIGSFAGALFAKDGAAFHSGGVRAFALGGIVDRPTFFGMRGGGLGVAGEAGAEGIVPLRRGRGGRLGVEVMGGGGGRIVINQEIRISGAHSITRRELEDALAQSNARLAETVRNQQARSL